MPKAMRCVPGDNVRSTAAVASASARRFSPLSELTITSRLAGADGVGVVGVAVGSEVGAGVGEAVDVSVSIGVGEAAAGGVAAGVGVAVAVGKAVGVFVIDRVAVGGAVVIGGV